jgi:hypothetical protein
MKKVFSVILAIAMIVCMSSISAFAAGETEVSNAMGIGDAGNYKLTADIIGSYEFKDGTYVIDLNGHMITGSITVNGADVTINDSSADKTGGVYTDSNDAIMVDAGKLVANGIQVTTMRSDCDGFFVGGGEVIINDCEIIAQNAGVQSKAASAKVVVNGGSIVSTLNALKVKNDAVIEVGGDLTMSGTMNVDTNTCTAAHTVEKAFVASEGYEIVFGGAAGAVTATVNSLNAEEPTEAPTAVPTEVPTEDPTEVPTEAPAVEPTEKPADSTEAPVATENAVVEGSDSSAKDAKGGCGSVVGGVGAVFALMAAAVVVLKKRK